MASKKKLLQAAAGSAGGAGLDIPEVFSTYVYDGTGSAQTITNGIDLSGEGGLVWAKRRDLAAGHHLYDTERGVTKRLRTDGTGAESTVSDGVTSFNSNGFSIGSNANINGSGITAVSWTFRKAPKFFDVGTISFNSSGVGSYSHNLGVTPAMVIFKLTNTTGDWFVWHKDLTSQNYAMFLNSTAASSNQGSWATYTDTTVTFDSSLFANDTAVVYLFAHNNNDGEFGPDADQDVIKCGSYTGNGSSTGPSVNLGFEPQWIMIKKTNSSQNAHWYVFDAMRGIVTGGDDPYLYANNTNAEVAGNVLEVTPTGFQLNTSANGFNGSGDTYIYMAIRRGPLAEPENATDVFAIDTGAGTSTPMFTSNFPVDMAINRVVDSSNDNNIVSRLTGKQRLKTNSADAESLSNPSEFDFMDGWYDGTLDLPTFYSWMWKRAPSYFDVVAYTGTGSARTQSHNLGVAPEMIWVKSRETVLNATDWWVFHKNLSTPADDSLRLNSTGAENTGNGALLWNSTMPTSSVFSLGTYSSVNQSGKKFIAYLFATVAGVSKVGYWNPPSSGDLNVDCGFSNGAKLVIIKRTDFSSPWWLWDSTRGIVAGNDPYIVLQSNSTEASNYDAIDPYSAGFTIPSSAFGSIFSSGTSAKYIFYAVAA